MCNDWHLLLCVFFSAILLAGVFTGIALLLVIFIGLTMDAYYEDCDPLGNGQVEAGDQASVFLSVIKIYQNGLWIWKFQVNDLLVLRRFCKRQYWRVQERRVPFSANFVVIFMGLSGNVSIKCLALSSGLERPSEKSWIRHGIIDANQKLEFNDSIQIFLSSHHSWFLKWLWMWWGICMVYPDCLLPQPLVLHLGMYWRVERMSWCHA